MASTEWRVGDQSAATLSNVGRDQYNFIAQQRESFLREVAAAKTKARRVIWTGFGLFCIGLVIAAIGWAKHSSEIFSAETDFENFGGGIAVFAVGGAINAIGCIVMLVGLVLHIVAAARRRRAETEFSVVGSRDPAGG